MSYETPTIDQFVVKFPEFKEVSAPKITEAITDAMRSVDNTWLEDDYQRAILLLAAHLLATGASASETMGGASGEIASEHIGRISVTYRDKKAAVAETSADLSSTTYGAAYVELRKLNHPSFLVI